MEDHHNEDIKETVRQMVLAQQDAIYADKDQNFLGHVEKELFRMYAQSYTHRDPKTKEAILKAYEQIKLVRERVQKLKYEKWDEFYKNASAVFTED